MTAPDDAARIEERAGRLLDAIGLGAVSTLRCGCPREVAGLRTHACRVCVDCGETIAPDPYAPSTALCTDCAAADARARVRAATMIAEAAPALREAEAHWRAEDEARLVALRPPHDVVVVVTALAAPLRWRCCKCDREWVLDPASGRDDLADPETGSASACPIVGTPRMVVDDLNDWRRDRDLDEAREAREYALRWADDARDGDGEGW